MGTQRRISVGREAREESCESKSRLGNRERTAHLIIISKLFKGIHHLDGTKVDTAKHNMRFAARTNVGLQGRLPVEFDGEIDDIAAFHKAERRGVSPSAGNVNAHRTARPYYLVCRYRHAWHLLLGEDSLR